MLYLPINRTWIVSRWAQHLYLACAIAALALFGIMGATLMALSAAGGQSLEGPAASIVRGLLLPAVLGTALLYVAMWYFWFNFDQSKVIVKAIWFLLLLFFVLVGPALYYFAIYRRSSVLDR